MSPIGSGLAAQLGAKKETTYGTRVVPTAFYEFMSEGAVSQLKYLESRQIRAGRFFQSAPRRIVTTSDAQVSINAEIPNKGFGLFLDLLHGNVVTPVQQGTTTAYLQTHNITGDPNKSATIQLAKPDTGGVAGTPVARPFDYLGCMTTSASFSVATDDWLKVAMTMDSQDEDTSQTLATASYPTALEGFDFQMATVTVNSIVQNFATGGLVKNWSFDLGLPRNVDRYGLRSSAFKAKPILNDYTPGGGSLGFEFSDLTQYNLYANGTKVPLVVDFTSPTLAGTAFPFKLTFTFASVMFTGTTPVVAGPDILGFDAPYVVMDDGTNPPCVITYTSTDSAVL